MFDNSKSQNIKTDIAQTIGFVIDQIISDLKFIDTNDPKIKIQIDIRIKELMGKKKLAKTSSFCNGVIDFLSERNCYHDNDVIDKMDENIYLFAFNNGVYDLKEGIFRKIHCQDYISFTCGYDYNPIINKEIRGDIMKFLWSLFENEETMNYFIKTLSLCLCGENKFQEFYIHTGIGSNGKSTMLILLKVSFGKYLKIMDISFLTKESKGQSDATPDLADKKGCRLVITSEPEKSDMLQVNKLKRLTGDCVITARALFKNPIEYKPQFKTFIQGNDIPKLSKLDLAIQRRIRVVNFPFKFTYNPIEENERLIDIDLEKKLITLEWKQQFMLILIEYYNEYIKNAKNLPVPSILSDSTNEYLTSNNPIKDWLFINYEITKKEQDKIQSSVLFKEFLKLNNGEINEKKFSEYMSILNIIKKRYNSGIYFIGIKKINTDYENE